MNMHEPHPMNNQLNTAVQSFLNSCYSEEALHIFIQEEQERGNNYRENHTTAEIALFCCVYILVSSVNHSLTVYKPCRSIHTYLSEWLKSYHNAGLVSHTLGHQSVMVALVHTNLHMPWRLHCSQTIAQLAQLCLQRRESLLHFKIVRENITHKNDVVIFLRCAI